MMDMRFEWPETVAFLFLFIGFVTALFARNAYILYAVCFLIGLLFGRIWWRFKGANAIPVFYAIMTFFLGFILGAIYQNLRIVSILLLGGILVGYWLHEKKIITSTEF